MIEQNKFPTQNIILQNRKELSVSGVIGVESFDETEIVAVTQKGMLNIKGENVKITSFNEEIGEITATGEFYAFIYLGETEKKGGFISRIFK